MQRAHPIWMCPVCDGRSQTAGRPSPVGDRALIRRERRFVCAAGHSFDVAREGYVNLILAHQRSSAEAGDPPDALRHRRAFLQAGHYQPLAERVVEIAAAHLAATPACGQVLDAGCGEGYLLRCLQAGIEAGQAGFHGVDISRPAVRMAARAGHRIACAVGNTFRLPVLAGAVQIFVVAMAPLDAVEARRVLGAGGVLIWVVPGAGHLAAFRSLAYGEAQPHPQKETPAGFRLSAAERVRFPLHLRTPASVTQLLEMTPYKWHMDPPTYARARRLRSLADTADFTVRVMEPA